MIRYRSSTTVPGVNRPWSIDPDEVSQPLVVVFGWPDDDASLVAPLPFVLLSLWIDGPGAVLSAVQHLSLKSMAAVAYIAWISTLLGFGLWTYLMSRYPVNRVAPFTLLVPVVGLTTGWLVFGEALQPVHFAGAGLLMAGLAVNVFGGPVWSRLRARRPAKAR